MEPDVELDLALIALQSHGVRARLLAEVSGPLRYAPFAPRVAKFFGISRAAAEAALARIVDPAAWLTMPIGGMHMSPVDATTPGQAMFLRADAGVVCPVHVHLGEERLLVLEGRLIEDSGLISGPGDLIIKRSGSRHSFCVPETGPCVSAYRIERGVSFS
jgi:putative transcriptional regulator